MSTVEAFNELFKNHKEIANCILTVTFDNGPEFARSLEMQMNPDGSKRFDSYYAHAYKSNDRAINENSNKEFRKFYRKGIILDNITKDEIERINGYLNSKPRERINWTTSDQQFEIESKKFNRSKAQQLLLEAKTT